MFELAKLLGKTLRKAHIQSILATLIRNILITEQKKEHSNKIKLKCIVVSPTQNIYLQNWAAPPPTHKTTSKSAAPITEKSKHRKKLKTIPNMNV